MAKNFPDILDSHIVILEQTLKDLKKLRKDQQAELTNHLRQTNVN